MWLNRQMIWSCRYVVPQAYNVVIVWTPLDELQKLTRNSSLGVEGYPKTDRNTHLIRLDRTPATRGRDFASLSAL